MQLKSHLFSFVLIALLSSRSMIHAQTDSSSVSVTLLSEMSRSQKHDLIRCPIHQKTMSINSQFSMHNAPENESDPFPFSIYNQLRRYCLPCSKKHRIALRKQSKMPPKKQSEE